MTRAQLRTAVRELAGRPASYARLSDDQIDAYAVEGMTRLAEETLPPSLVDTVTITTANGTASYAVGTTPLRIILLVLSGNVLDQVTTRAIYSTIPTWESASVGTPTHWWRQGIDASGNPKVTLYPCPGSTMSIKAVVLKRPAVLPSSGEILEWTLLEQQAIANYAAWRHLRCKTEADGSNHAELLMADFNAIRDLYARINGVDSYASDESDAQRRARGMQ